MNVTVTLISIHEFFLSQFRRFFLNIENMRAVSQNFFWISKKRAVALCFICQNCPCYKLHTKCKLRREWKWNFEKTFREIDFGGNFEVTFGARDFFLAPAQSLPINFPNFLKQLILAGFSKSRYNLYTKRKKICLATMMKRNFDNRIAQWNNGKKHEQICTKYVGSAPQVAANKQFFWCRNHPYFSIYK